MSARLFVSEQEIAEVLHKHRWGGTAYAVDGNTFRCIAGCKMPTPVRELTSVAEARHQASVVASLFVSGDTQP